MSYLQTPERANYCKNQLCSNVRLWPFSGLREGLKPTHNSRLDPLGSLLERAHSQGRPLEQRTYASSGVICAHREWTEIPK